MGVGGSSPLIPTNESTRKGRFSLVGMSGLTVRCGDKAIKKVKQITAWFARRLRCTDIQTVISTSNV